MSEPIPFSKSKLVVTQHTGPKGHPYEMIVVPNALAAKAGKFRAAAVNQGEVAVEISKLAQGYLDTVREEMLTLRSLWTTLAKDHDESREQEFFRIAHNFKGQAATFGYSLLGDIAASLCYLVEAGALKQPRSRLAVAAHVDALEGILRIGIKGGGGKVGVEIVQVLRDQVLKSVQPAK